MNRSALDAAYRRTHYEVLMPVAAPASAGGGGVLVLRIDVPCAALLDLHEQLEVGESGFISAWNPHSVACSEVHNAAAHQRLVARVAELGLDSWPGWGRDPLGEWPAEQSLFVAGLALGVAQRLGAEFSQHALVHAAADAVPRLLWL